jgi:hypothetical protein
MNTSNYFNARMTREVPGEGSPAPLAPATEPVIDPAPAAPAAVDLSFIPADFHDNGQPDLTKFRSHYEDMVAADAQRREAEANVPADGKYAFAIPDDLTFEGMDLPDGFKVDLATDDPVMAPLFDEMGALLKELNAPADAAGKAAGLIAKYEAAKESRDFTAWAADMKRLGPDTTVKARVAAIQRKLETALPADQVKALFSGPRISADGIVALEKLLAPRSMTGPGPQPNTNAHMADMPPGERLRAIRANG